MICTPALVSGTVATTWNGREVLLTFTVVIESAESNGRGEVAAIASAPLRKKFVKRSGERAVVGKHSDGAHLFFCCAACVAATAACAEHSTTRTRKQ